MSERIRQMTGGHLCEHRVQRATAQFTSYAGPVRQCICCRSAYGALRYQHQIVSLCPGCGGIRDKVVR